MKNKYFFALALLFSAQTLSAAPAVLLEKITTPGFIMPNYGVNKSCVIQRNGDLVISYGLNGLYSQRVTPLKLSLASLKTAIEQAALGAMMTTGVALPDVGSVSYAAYQPQSGGGMKKIVLWQSGSIGTQANTAPEATLLRNFIDLNCEGALTQ